MVGVVQEHRDEGPVFVWSYGDDVHATAASDGKYFRWPVELAVKYSGAHKAVEITSLGMMPEQHIDVLVENVTRHTGQNMFAPRVRTV